MADEKAEFRAALEEVRKGSPDAVWQFIEKYGPFILRIARRNLNTGMQSKFDSQDFVQMVWASFFRNPREIRSFESQEHLLAYLARLVQNKMTDEHRRRFGSLKNNVARERPLEAGEELPRRDRVTPSQVAIAKEVWERIIDGENPQNRSIARLRLGGATFVEISQKLGIHERTVRRVIERLLTTYEKRSARMENMD
jgi:RNA polymerase sigma factor (sigma-70 family)